MTIYTVSNYDSLLGTLANLGNSSRTDIINITASFTIPNSEQYPLLVSLQYNENLTINGNGHTISGQDGNFGGFFLAPYYNSPNSAQVAINDLTFTGMTARGQSGTNGSGGGAALGAGLFIGAGTAVTLTNVAVINNTAIGGAGGNASVNSYGAGGSLADTFSYYGPRVAGYQGGSAGYSDSSGGTGGYGAGGGSGVQGGAAGFGGGGSGDSAENNGGSQSSNLGAPGYGGGAAASNPGGNTDDQGVGAGGGGLAGGGGIFVQSGATLTIAGTFRVSGNTVVGGAGGTDSGGQTVYTPDGESTFVPGSPGQAGASLGSGIFLNDAQTLNFAPAAGQIDLIADQIFGVGSIGIALNGAGTLQISSSNTFASGVTVSQGSLQLSGADTISSVTVNGGSAQFSAANTISGNVTVTSGKLQLSAANAIAGSISVGAATLELGNNNAAGTAPITLTSSSTLILDSGVTTIANTLKSIGFGTTIDLLGFGSTGTATLGSNGVLSVTNGTTTKTLKTDLTTNSGYVFSTISDGNGGLDFVALKSIASEADLNTDIAYINAHPAGSYTLTFTQGFSLNANIAQINASGGTVTINGGGFTIDGANTYGGFFVMGGAVTINALTVAHTLERGGNGVNGGGGGAGFGGGLFVGAGASVVLNNTVFAGDVAQGGSGGAGTVDGGGGVGGGLFEGHIASADGFGQGGANGPYFFSDGNPGGYGGGGSGSGYFIFYIAAHGSGGFGAANGGDGYYNQGVGGATGNGGNGLGAGGAIFVQQGGTLALTGSFSESGSVAQGGGAYGSGIFVQGTQTLTFTPLGTNTIGDAIADETGSGGGGVGATGVVSLVLDRASGAAAGTLVLGGASTFAGGVTIKAGTLDLTNSSGAGSGAITFAPNVAATLELGAGVDPSNTIIGFNANDTFHLDGFSSIKRIALSANNVLTVYGATQTTTLALDPNQNLAGARFYATLDGNGGVFLSEGLLTDGNFQAVDLSANGPGVTVDVVHGNSSQTAPTGWSGGGAFAPTAIASSGFAGSQVATLSIGSMSQQFTPAEYSSGYVVSYDIGRRADITGSSTGTVSVYELNASGTTSVLIGQQSWNTANAAAGAVQHLSFTTTTAVNPAYPNIKVVITDNGVNQVLVDNVTIRPAVTAALAQDTGSSPIDGLTSNAALVGTTTANTAVSLQIDGVAGAATATSDVNGNWTYAPTLADGQHTIVASANGYSASVAFTLDTTPPVLAISPAASPTNNPVVALAGTIDVADAGDTVSIYDGTTLLGTTAPNMTTGAWSTSITLSGDGAHALTAQATDTAGNLGHSSPVAITLDTAAPVLTIASVAKSVSAPTALVSGTIDAADAGRPIAIYDNGIQVGTANAAAGGAWSKTITLANGVSTITAGATDLAGNTGTTATFAVPTPSLSITGVTGSPTSQSETVSGTIDAADAGLPISIFDNGLLVGTVTSATDGTWSQTVTLPGVANAITASATDQEGNTGTAAEVDVAKYVFSIANEADLNAALAQIDVGGTLSAPNRAYGFSLAAGATISLTSALDAINLAAGDTLAISGNGATIDGGGTQRGFFVNSGAVTISDLTIANAAAIGGAGAVGGGGGGAGLGGGLFVANNVANGAAAPGSATLIDVKFTGNSAAGGKGGDASVGHFGGGGGLGGAGSQGPYYFTADGFGYTGYPTSVAGGGGSGIPLLDAGSFGLGGGGGFDTDSGSGGGTGGSGGFGAGGGAAGSGGAGGFGGGGGGANPDGGDTLGNTGGAGGFGGGSGLLNSRHNISGDGPGGGGLGAGADIFVMQGATLSIQGGTAGAGTVTKGSGGQNSDGSYAGSGGAFGSGIFLQGGEMVTLGAGVAAGQTTEIDGVIADESGSGGTARGGIAVGGSAAGAPGLGTVYLTASNTFTGGVALASGTLRLGTTTSAGTGAITFAAGAQATLKLDAGADPTNLIAGFDATDAVDVAGHAFVNGDHLALQSQSGGVYAYALEDAANNLIAGTTLHFAAPLDAGVIAGADGGSGTEIAVAALLPVVSIPTISGTVAIQSTSQETALHPFAGATIGDANPGGSETLTITFTANGGPGGTFDGVAFSGSGSHKVTLTGTAIQVTSALAALTFTPVATSVYTSSTSTFSLSDLSSASATAATATVAVTDTSTNILYNAAGQPIYEALANGVVETLTYNADSSLHQESFSGVTGQNYTGYTFTFVNGVATEETIAGVTGGGYTPIDITFNPTGARTSITFANGVMETLTYNSDGSLNTIAGSGIAGNTYASYTDTYTNGVLTDERYSGVTGTGFTPTDVTYTSTGARASVTYVNGAVQSLTYNADGSLKTNGYTGLTGLFYTGYTDTYANGVVAQSTYTGVSGHTYTGYTDTFANGKVTEEHYSGVTDTGMTPTDVTYTSTGARASTTYANGITQTMTYNANGTLATIGQTGLSGFSYGGYTDTYLSGAIVQESFTGVTGYSDGSFAITERTAPLTQLLTADSYGGGTDVYGGTLELGALGAAGSGAIRFHDAATLQLDAGALTTTSTNHFDFANLIAGATSTSQVIDLKSLAYVANATTAMLNGTTLDVSNGMSDVTLHLASAPATGSTFKTAADATGGTLVYDPPADAIRSLHSMVQAMATMTPSASASLTPSAPAPAHETHLAAPAAA